MRRLRPVSASLPPAPLHALGPWQHHHKTTRSNSLCAVDSPSACRPRPGREASAHVRPAGTRRHPTPGHAGQSAGQGVSGHKGQTEHRQTAGSSTPTKMWANYRLKITNKHREPVLEVRRQEERAGTCLTGRQDAPHIPWGGASGPPTPRRASGPWGSCPDAATFPVLHRGPRARPQVTSNVTPFTPVPGAPSQHAHPRHPRVASVPPLPPAR